MWSEQTRGASPAGSAIGIGVVGVGLLVGELPRGGVAPLAIAAGVALFLGAPAALAEWRTPVPGEVQGVRESLADILGLGVAAAVLGSVGAGSWLALVAAVGAWFVGALTHHRAGSARWVYLALLAAAGLGAAGSAATADTPPPWTLLAPLWSEGARWGPVAVLAGLWLAGVGTGQWVGGPPRRPGHTRAPLAPIGAGLLLVSLLAVTRGAAYEAHLGLPAFDVSQLWLALAAASTTGAVIGRPRGVGGSVGVRALAGAALTVVVAALSGEARMWFASSILAWVGAGSLAITAWFATGIDRGVAGLAALVLVAASLATGRPTLGTVADAWWLGAACAVAFWLVATRLVMARRHA